MSRDNVLLLANPGSEFNTLSEPDDQQPMEGEEEEGDGTESPILSSEGSARTTMTTPKEEGERPGEGGTDQRRVINGL